MEFDARSACSQTSGCKPHRITITLVKARLIIWTHEQIFGGGLDLLLCCRRDGSACGGRTRATGRVLG